MTTKIFFLLQRFSWKKGESFFISLENTWKKNSRQRHFKTCVVSSRLQRYIRPSISHLMYLSPFGISLRSNFCSLKVLNVRYIYPGWTRQARQEEGRELITRGGKHTHTHVHDDLLHQHPGYVGSLYIFRTGIREECVSSTSFRIDPKSLLYPRKLGIRHRNDLTQNFGNERQQS